jgi:hypothetical protein
LIDNRRPTLALLNPSAAANTIRARKATVMKAVAGGL